MAPVSDDGDERGAATGSDRYGEAEAAFLGEIATQVAPAVDNMLAYEEIARLEARLEEENVYLQEEIRTAHNFAEIIGQGPAMRRVLVKVNCAAIPAGLFESELFGHEKGAFTGAVGRKIGRFELADGGTIFLDEVGELPLELQPKLLRVLQEGEFERVGGPTVEVDVRVIAATNRDLEAAVRDGRFRADLFYRLNVFPLEIPPLRQRPGDVPLLVGHFAAKYARKLGRTIETIPKPALERLEAYPWPGNVRELENVIERAVIVSRGPKLELGEWFPAPQVGRGARVRTLEELEREHIVAVLEMTAWRVSGERGAAKILGLKPTTLDARMKKLGIRRKG
jgi:formate hydrogenlyase transcriptional activator